jgi:hypothetical protein
LNPFSHIPEANSTQHQPWRLWRFPRQEANFLKF